MKDSKNPIDVAELARRREASVDQWIKELPKQEKDEMWSNLDEFDRYKEAIKSHRKDSAVAMYRVFQGLVDSYAFSDFLIRPIECSRRNYSYLRHTFSSLRCRLLLLKINYEHCVIKSSSALCIAAEIDENRRLALKEAARLGFAKSPKPEKPQSIEDIVSEGIGR